MVENPCEGTWRRAAESIDDSVGVNGGAGDGCWYEWYWRCGGKQNMDMEMALEAVARPRGDTLNVLIIVNYFLCLWWGQR